MYVQLNAVIVDADANNRNELAQFLGAFGVNCLAQLPSVDALPSYLSRPDVPQLVVVNLDPNPGEALKKIGHLPRQYPQVSLFAMSQVLDPNLLMEAMHLGVREFIPLPIAEQKFAAAVERVAATNGMGRKGRVIHVIPTQGGCGSTTIACNVAASLGQSSAASVTATAAAGGVASKTALLDLDLARGGCAGYFDTRPRYTIADVMDGGERVDKQLLDNALAVHRASHVAILARPELPEDSQRVNAQGVTRLVSVLGRSFDHIVIDSVMSVDPVYAAAVQASDVNLIVMQLNVPSCKNAERFVGTLRRMGVESGKIRLVVNRFVKKGWDIEPDEVERALGLKISWMVPNDFKNAIAAINYGEPVVLRAPRSEISVSLQGLAQSLSGAGATAMKAAA